MSFEPYPSQSRYYFLGATILFAVVALYLFDQIMRGSFPPSFSHSLGFVIALPLAFISGYLTLMAFRLSYHLNRNGLLIETGSIQHRIPLSDIQNIAYGKDLDVSSSTTGLNLMGLRLGQKQVSDDQIFRYYATVALSDSLVVKTEQHSYVISPENTKEFVQAWQTRQELGPTQAWTLGTQRSWPANWLFLKDGIAGGLLGVGLLACIILFGYILLIYPDLPSQIPLHFDATGQADRIADKAMLLSLPIIGALMFGLNTIIGTFLYFQEKLAAYLLWAGTIVVTIGLFIGLMMLIS